MTSVDGITQFGNESEVNREKGDPQLKKNHQQKKNCHPEEQSAKHSSELLLSFIFSKLLTTWYF